MPKTLQELRAHENEITKVRKAVFNGLNQMIVVELGTNPLKSSGIENGAFQGMKKLSYIRIADTNITTIPKGDRKLSKASGIYKPKGFDILKYCFLKM